MFVVETIAKSNRLTIYLWGVLALFILIQQYTIITLNRSARDDRRRLQEYLDASMQLSEVIQGEVWSETMRDPSGKSEMRLRLLKQADLVGPVADGLRAVRGQVDNLERRAEELSAALLSDPFRWSTNQTTNAVFRNFNPTSNLGFPPRPDMTGKPIIPPR